MKSLLPITSVIVCAQILTAQVLNINLASSTAAPTTTTIAPVAGLTTSAAAPAEGDVWNVFGRSSTVPQQITAGSTHFLYSDSALVDGLGAATDVTLSISYIATVTTGTRTEPSTANGNNTIQPGGVMANAWRNYYNASGNYLEFTLEGLTPNAEYDFYVYGGTGAAGQGVAIKTADGLDFADPLVTSNTSLGSLYTGSNPYSLVSQGDTWDMTTITTGADGSFTFQFRGAGSTAYFSGFQLLELPDAMVPEPSTLGLGLGLAAFGLCVWRRRSVR